MQKRILFYVVFFLHPSRALSLDVMENFNVLFYFFCEHIYIYTCYTFSNNNIGFIFIFFSILVPMFSNRKFGQQETTCHLLLKELQVLSLI